MQEYPANLSEWGQWFDGFVSSTDDVVLFESEPDEQFRFDEPLEANFLATRVAPPFQQLSIHHAITRYTRQLFHLLGGVPSRTMFDALQSSANDLTSQLAGSELSIFNNIIARNKSCTIPPSAAG